MPRQHLAAARTERREVGVVGAPEGAELRHGLVEQIHKRPRLDIADVEARRPQQEIGDPLPRDEKARLHRLVLVTRPRLQPVPQELSAFVAEAIPDLVPHGRVALRDGGGSGVLVALHLLAHHAPRVEFALERIAYQPIGSAVEQVARVDARVSHGA